MAQTLLTIAIPTFSRLEPLKKAIMPLLLLASQPDLELLIVDNDSQDGTWEWLSAEVAPMGARVLRQKFNVGIEGNIITALMQASGRYVWLLSDHMSVDIEALKTFIEQLRDGLEFDIAYARIAQYEAVLGHIGQGTKLSSLGDAQLSRFLFFTSNISGLIISANLLQVASRYIYRFSGFSYPHLGVYVAATPDSLLFETGVLSAFQARKPIAPIRVSYDMFKSRFIGFASALVEIRRLNGGIGNPIGALKGRLLRGPLVADSIGALCFSDPMTIAPADFLRCTRGYPLYIKSFLLFCSAAALLPRRFRLLIVSASMSIVRPGYIDSLRPFYLTRFASESIKE